MENGKKDKTKKLIENTFIELVEEKGYSKVTIKNITEKAQINRNTFYLHYQDKEDLIDKIIMNVFNSQEKELLKLTINYSDNSEVELKKIITNILSIIYEEVEFYRIIISDPALKGYITKLTNIIKLESVEEKNISSQKHIFYDYVLSGMLGVFSSWILHDNYSIDDIATTLSKLILNNYKTIYN